MADVTVMERILQDIVVSPIDRVRPGFPVFALIAAVIVVTLILVRKFFRKK